MTDTMTLTTHEQLSALSDQVAELAAIVKAQQHRQDEQYAKVQELLGEVNALGRPAMDLAMSTLADLEAKGYFAFAKESAGVLDTIVTSFGPDDVRQLGDNVVTILTTVREMTQPEVMELVRRTAETAQDTETEAMTPPSTFALLRQMRDPEVRRGLARVMAMLQTVGADPSTTSAAATHDH